MKLAHAEEVLKEREHDKEAAQYVGNAELQEVDGQKLLRKLDWHLIPWFSLLYLLSFLDSTVFSPSFVLLTHIFSSGSAIGNARVSFIS